MPDTYSQLQLGLFLKICRAIRLSRSPSNDRLHPAAKLGRESPRVPCDVSAHRRKLPAGLLAVVRDKSLLMHGLLLNNKMHVTPYSRGGLVHK